ncbi:MULTISPECIES: reverse transcriptase domain-containing protein [unclassified Mesorhizobium]|uniref:reverse transcriptase domain-containing protein n=1 Tax=unclassified Mesorhizobium TaxID=325217 RepID=UPI001FDF5D6E|nr:MULTISPECIES: reverse transcriptase domain-containing protein [unclassified Mesorhizobium]
MKNGKPIFVPNPFGEELGRKLKRRVEKKYTFDKFIYHFKEGSHVVALHRHRKNAFFCRVDISRFFYSIKRNRLKRILKDIGIPKPEYYAKFSTVKNPFEGGGYVLPYGFVQSPILATLVLAESPIGTYLRGLPATIAPSVYMDDLCLSGPDHAALKEAFDGLVRAVAEAGFTLNDDKTREPAEKIDIFNCLLENGNTAVLPERIDEFFAEDREAAAVESFETYVDIVQSKTWRIGESKKRRRKAFEERRKKAAVPTA